MKNNFILKIKLISIFLLCAYCLNAQRLTISDLVSLCSKKNWTSVNQTLLNKGWVYYKSQEGEALRYNTITWAYKKNNFSDEAQAWFNLHTYNEQPDMLVYTIFNKESHDLINNALNSNGYKLIGGKIKDDQIISTYVNQNYILKISSFKEDKSGREDVSITGYRITLIRKGGAHDPDNGIKYSYHENGNIKELYTLKDGKINGLVKSYSENGHLNSMTNCVMGRVEGMRTQFTEDGKVLKEVMYHNDEKNGKDHEFIYNSDGVLLGEAEGVNVDNEKEGRWNVFVYRDNNKVVYEYTTYKLGIKEGPFKLRQGDSLVYGSYSNDELHGEYKMFLDSKIFGVVLDSTGIVLFMEKGNYVEGKKHGKWSYWGGFGMPIHEEFYMYGKKAGTWKYYYAPHFNSENKEPLAFNGKCYLTEMYQNDELVKTICHSFLRQRKVLCDTSFREDTNSLDSCYITECIDVEETSNYKNGKLNGYYCYRDSDGKIELEGNYIDDKREGNWRECPILHEWKGKYSNGEREGIWTKTLWNSVINTAQYVDGKLNGECFAYAGDKKNKIWCEINENNNPKLFLIYDSLENVQSQYKVLQDNKSFFLIEWTDYNGSTMEFHVDKSVCGARFGYENTLLFRSEGLYFPVLDINIEESGDKSYPNGKMVFRDANRQKRYEGSYFKENRVGLWSFYYQEQNVVMRVEYQNNKPMIETEQYLTMGTDKLYSGILKYEGDLSEERTIRDGVRNGKTLYRDYETQKILRKEIYKKGVLSSSN